MSGLSRTQEVTSVGHVGVGTRGTGEDREGSVVSYQVQVFIADALHPVTMLWRTTKGRIHGQQ